MAMLIKYRDGSSELLPGATRVDQQNYHEGMFDFYDKNGNLLKQIDMYMEISWEHADEPTSNSLGDPSREGIEKHHE